MSASVYNVIWADDECATLMKDKTVRSFFTQYGIKVLDYVPTSEALRLAIDRNKDRVDAVIVDGNFSKADVVYLESDDISGLIHTASLIELYNVRREIPFFLFTARKVFLEQTCKNREIDYFVKQDRLIQKGDIEGLTKRIIEAVDHINSDEHRVETKYAVLLNMAKEKLGPHCSDILYNFLLADEKDVKYDHPEVQFNQLRQILETIYDNLKKAMIIPDDRRISLNTFIPYLSGRLKDIKPTDKRYCFPNATSWLLTSVIHITQDGSHSEGDLRLKVAEYVSSVQTPFLFRSCLYAVMDAIRWYNDLMNKL